MTDEYPYVIRCGNNAEIHAKSLTDYDNLIADIKRETLKDFERMVKNDWRANLYDSPDIEFDYYIGKFLKEITVAKDNAWEMRKRLIELVKEADNKVGEVLFSTKKSLTSDEWGAIFADYLLENGVVVLPCKVGDTVYDIGVNPREVLNIEYYAKENRFNIWLGLNYFKSEDIGKTVFLTRKEAEQAIERMK